MVQPGRPGGGPAKKAGRKGSKGRGKGKGKGGTASGKGGKGSRKGSGKGDKRIKKKGGKGSNVKAAKQLRGKAGAKGLGKSKVQQEAATELDETRKKARKESIEATKRGVKRKSPGAGKPQESDAKEATGDASTKKVKRVSFRKARKKEVTALYAELINPGRSRKPDEVVEDILKLLESRNKSLEEYSCSKIGSRILQACLKWGTPEQRRRLLNALKEHLPGLATNNHGHIVVQKLLRYTSRVAAKRKLTESERKEQAQVVRVFMDAFRGRPLRIAFYHKYGCRVINSLYHSEVVPAKEKRRLLQEVLIPETVTLTSSQAPGTQTVRQIMKAKGLSDDHKSSIAAHLRECADKAVNKELLGIDMVHFIFQSLCEDADEANLRKLADQCAAGSPFLLSSRPGAEALLRLLGVFTAKERRAFCKELKGKFVQLATNSVDYVVMIRLLMTIDDTVMLSKTLLAEWIADIEALIYDKYGHKALAWLFTPDDPRVFSPYEIGCAALPAPSSMKAKETRLEEMVRVVRPPVRNVLLADPLKAAADLHAKDILIAFLKSQWAPDVVEALVAAACVEVEKEDCGMLGTGTSTTTMLVLLRMEPAEAETSLQKLLWERCFSTRLAQIATSRCAFLLLELVKNSSVKDLARKSLLKARKEVEVSVKAAETKGLNVAGAGKLLECLSA